MWIQGSIHLDATREDFLGIVDLLVGKGHIVLRGRFAMRDHGV